MYQKTTLDNGLRIITHDLEGRDSVAIGLWIASGGRYEGDRVKGAAHFLEHMAFKGSKKFSCNQIKEKVEGVGGTLNAFTTEEQTCYYAKIPSKHIAIAFDVLADIVFYPSIPADELTKEKGVIIEEIKMYHDLPQYFVLDLLDEMMWPGHPLGKNLVGTEASIAGMSSRDLKGFHGMHYGAGNAVVAACGKIRHKSFVDLVQKRLKSLRPSVSQSFVPARNSQHQAQVKFARKDIEQMHVALGMFGLRQDHKDKYILTLLSIILGGNMSSRLFNEVREKRGLAYSIGTSGKAMKDTGLFMIRAGVDNRKIVDTVDLVIKELNKIKRSGVTLSEFSRAKDYFLGQLSLGLEDSLDHMLWLGDALSSLNRTLTLKEILGAVNRIKREDIQRLARQIFDEQHYNLAIVGPLKAAQERSLARIMAVKI